MACFEYEGIDQVGAICEGTEEANSGEELCTRLLSRGIYPTVVRSISRDQLRTRKRLERYKKARDQMHVVLGEPSNEETPPCQRVTKIDLSWALLVAAIMILLLLIIARSTI